MLTKEGSNKIVNFMNPRAGIIVLGCGHVSHIVMDYFLKNLSLYSQTLIRQTMYIVMMTKEGSTKVVNFMTPGVGVLMLGRCHISQHSEYLLSCTLSIYLTLIAIMLMDYGASILYHC